MQKWWRGCLCVVGMVLMPGISWAQDGTDSFHGLQLVLENLYDQMIPLSSQLIGVGRAIGGFAALFYIASRVWGHLARAESIDLYPLLRPFVIGFCIVIFPSVLALLNGILQPTVAATDAMVGNTNQALYAMLDGKNKAITDPPPSAPALTPETDPANWYQYAHPESTNASSNPIADAFSAFSIRNLIRTFIAETLEFLYKAAALCIDTIRTFKLIVLAILGPFVFGLSIFDGFQHTLRQWLARYVNVFMWLPVANIFGAITAKIQLNMMQLELAGGYTDSFFQDTNTAYLIFLVIAIVGYFTVPSIASYIIHAGSHALLRKTSALASTTVSAVNNAFTGGATAMMNSNSKKESSPTSDFKTKKITGE